MKITVDEARDYFQHVSQQKGNGVTPDELPDHDGLVYYAHGGVCVLFHIAHWPGVWMAHVAVKPEAWGRTVIPGRKILNKFWNDESPTLILGWTDQNNRAALSFARRVGFTEIGTMQTGVVMQEWTPCQ